MRLAQKQLLEQHCQDYGKVDVPEELGCELLGADGLTPMEDWQREWFSALFWG